MASYTPILSEEVVLLILEQVCLPSQAIPKRELIFSDTGLTNITPDTANAMSCLSALLSASNLRLVPIHHSSVTQATI
jgi:hypothetical protein